MLGRGGFPLVYNRIESGCKIEAMYPPMCAKASLFCTNISLWHEEHVRDPIERSVILTDTPFLGLSRVVHHFCVVLWGYGMGDWGFDVICGRESLFHLSAPLGV